MPLSFVHIASALVVDSSSETCHAVKQCVQGLLGQAVGVVHGNGSEYRPHGQRLGGGLDLRHGQHIGILLHGLNAAQAEQETVVIAPPTQFIGQLHLIQVLIETITEGENLQIIGIVAINAQQVLPHPEFAQLVTSRSPNQGPRHRVRRAE